MLDLKNFDVLRESQPYYIYHRVSLAGPEGYFFHAIDYGFWYLMRRIHCAFPEVDAAAAAFYPELRVNFNLRATNVWPQNVPIPFRLFSTPNSEGVQVNAANQLTATGPKNVKLLNIVYPFRDNIELYITGQNPPGSPPFVDICSIGYLIPNTVANMWEGE